MNEKLFHGRTLLIQQSQRATDVFGEGDRNHRIAYCHNSALKRMRATPKAQAAQFAANVLPIGAARVAVHAPKAFRPKP
jgi:hypothetical protein